jgi:DNA-binding XRE family transcriptional regulator
VAPPSSFAPIDPLSLSTAELTLYNLCRAISEAPSAEAGTPAGRVQRHFLDGDAANAIRVLKALLDEAGVHAGRRVVVNAERFAQIRELRNHTQQDLAAAVGVKPAVVSHVEQGRNSLSVVRLVLAASLLDVPLSQLLHEPEAARDGDTGRA